MRKYVLFKCFWGAKSYVDPLSGFWEGPWPRALPLDPPMSVASSFPHYRDHSHLPIIVINRSWTSSGAGASP